MLKSMTGYGRGKLLNDDREYTVEIKTINHRYNETSIRMPRYLNFLEDKIRQYVAKKVLRGKVDVYISVMNLSSKGKNINIDKSLVGIYINEMKNLIDIYNLPDDISLKTIMTLPDVITIKNEDDESLYWEEIKVATDIAIENLMMAREEEGSRLKSDIESRLERIKENVLRIEENSSCILDEYKNKLETRLKELDATKIIDESRIGVEVVLFADKSSICEEITRLKSHIQTLWQMINSENSVIGKKLDFLVQEMNREINTIGSKANSLEITNYVVDTKNEIENIREQVQNIE